MSRIGKSIIEIPAGVTVTVKDNVVTVKGPKGELSQEITGGITIEQEDGKVSVSRPSDAKNHRALHGLYRALINNMVVGTHEGFTKKLELVGVGYRASHSGQKLELALGFSHGIVLELPSEITIDTLTEKVKTQSSLCLLMTNNYWEWWLLKFAHSENQNLTKVKVWNSLVK